jgi:hypothetical protein
MGNLSVDVRIILKWIVDWTELPQDPFQCLALENKVMYLRFP